MQIFGDIEVDKRENQPKVPVLFHYFYNKL